MTRANPQKLQVNNRVTTCRLERIIDGRQGTTKFERNVDGRQGTRKAAWIGKFVLLCARVYLLAAHPMLACQFARRLKFLPNLGLPRRYHEKLLWRKIVDHNAIFVDLSDKLTAKAIAKARCPELALTQVLWTGTNPRSLPPSLIASEVVIKANHGSGFNIFVAKGKPEYLEIVAKLERWMKISFDRKFGEWGYRDVAPRIFIEEKLVLGGGDDLPTDIKVHVFGSQIGRIWVCNKRDRRSRTYDADGAPLRVRDWRYPSQAQALPDTPATRELILQAMEFAARLAGQLDYCRVDFMVAGGRLYFGEYTLYPSGGYDVRLDPVLLQRAQVLWDLRNSGFCRKSHRGLWRFYAEALRSAIDQEDPVAQRRDSAETQLAFSVLAAQPEHHWPQGDRCNGDR